VCVSTVIHLLFTQLYFSSNLTIPRPSNEIPQIAAPSGSGLTLKLILKSKKGKPMEPSKVLTAWCVFL
jgi:hypothetical protein